MGKKKNKFRQSQKPRIQNEVARETTTISIPNPSNTQVETVKTAPEAPIKVDRETELNAKYAHIRKDVNKLLIVIASLTIIFVGIYILGQKTDVLTNIGDWIYKIGNFQLQ
ncbi:MAG: hypothetical protein WC227_01315 [Patescibacteria group bacterium]|jgi:hypothetical protein